jgi:hypothetical protein
MAQLKGLTYKQKCFKSNPAIATRRGKISFSQHWEITYYSKSCHISRELEDSLLECAMVDVASVFELKAHTIQVPVANQNRTYSSFLHIDARNICMD